VEEKPVFDCATASRLFASDLDARHAEVNALKVTNCLTANNAVVTSDTSDIQALNSTMTMNNNRVFLNNNAVFGDGGMIKMAATSVYLTNHTNLHFGKLVFNCGKCCQSEMKPCDSCDSCEIYRGSELDVSYDGVFHMTFTPYCYHCTRFNPAKVDFKKKIEEHYKDAEADRKLETI